MKKLLSMILVITLLFTTFGLIPVYADGVSISPDKAAYTLKEEMKITVTGVTSEMEDNYAFVSITKQKARPEDYGTYEYARDLYETDGVWTVKAPEEPGDYEVRFYAADDDYKN